MDIQLRAYEALIEKQDTELSKMADDNNRLFDELCALMKIIRDLVQPSDVINRINNSKGLTDKQKEGLIDFFHNG